jgi:hypothetical protein
MDNSDDSKKSFFKYVFNFEDESKSEIINLLQFSLISFIPIVLLSKLLEKYSPSKDETKGSLEITAEIIIQTIVLFIGLFFINRITMFFPTFSGENYPKINTITSVLSISLSLIFFSSNINEKINILTERINDLWEGKTDKNSKTKTVNVNGKQVTVKVTQPNSQQQKQPSSMSMSSSQSVYNDGTAINQLPTNDMSRAQEYSLSSQSLPNYDAMYRQDNTPLVGAATPGGGTEGFMQEPMAANDALGSWGGFSSW